MASSEAGRNSVLLQEGTGGLEIVISIICTARDQQIMRCKKIARLNSTRSRHSD